MATAKASNAPGTHPVIQFCRCILPALEFVGTFTDHIEHPVRTSNSSKLRICYHVMLDFEIIQQIEIGIQIVIFL